MRILILLLITMSVCSASITPYNSKHHYDGSSTGRAVASKTSGCRFESYPSCPVANQSILDAAEDRVGDRGAGCFGCATVVSSILRSVGFHVDTMSTQDLGHQLSKSGFSRVSLSDARPGDVIISPTEGRNHGHTGIIGKNGMIISNNSASGLVAVDFDVRSWRKYYCQNKGLDVDVYRKE